MQKLIDKAKSIRLVIFDVDGVLTTGKLTYTAKGIEHKDFHVHDGQGIKLLLKTGVDVAIITTCKSETIGRRMQDLGIPHVYQGQVEKLPAYEELKQKLKLTDAQIAYIGDDLPDLPILCRVGLAVTVPNAPRVLHEHASWVTKRKGGKGAARELCEFIMDAQNTYQSIVDSYLQK